MTDKQKLEELIQLAVDSGWDEFGHTEDHFWTFEQKTQYLLVEIVDRETQVGYNYDVSTILFDHGFAKAVFGEDNKEFLDCGHSGSSKYFAFEHVCKNWGGSGFSYNTTSWKHHIKELAITPEQDRISYVYDNRRRDV